MALYLLAGTPGLSKTDIASKIVKYLVDKELSVRVSDVEQELVNLYPEDSPSRRAHSKALVGIIGQTPQDEIRTKWTEAYRRAVAKARDGSPQVSIVICRLQYYRSETKEFYSPVDVDAVRESPPKVILTLIDDIFDVYYHLSQSGEVFDIQGQVEHESDGSTEDVRLLYKLSLVLATNSLLRVLTWREREIGTAAMLARVVKAQHRVLATKHPVAHGALVLLDRDSVDLGLPFPYLAYVSHPISRPRKETIKTGSWPPFVQEMSAFLDSVAGASDSVSLVPVMPTAIDEYRFFSDGTYLHPYLLPRWPLQAGELMYCQPERPEGQTFRSYAEYERLGIATIFDPPLDKTGRRIGFPLGDAEVSGILRALQQAITIQMAGRDHLLVRQCPALLLYRPTYDEYRFSGGVVAELHTFSQIAKRLDQGLDSPGPRRLCFVHDQKDAGETLRKSEVAIRLAGGKIQQAADAIRKNQGKTRPAHVPAEKLVADALCAFGLFTDEVEKVHSSMFISSDSSIGGEEVLPLATTEAKIKEAIVDSRLSILAADSDFLGNYYYRTGDNEFSTTQPGSTPLAAHVWNNLPNCIQGAATKARQHLLNGVLPPNPVGTGATTAQSPVSPPSSGVAGEPPEK
jgi:hypothetical protein